MRSLKRALVAVVLLLLAAVVLFFVLENQQPVPVVLLGWSSPAIPIAVLVLLALVAGLAIGPLLGVFSVMRARRRIRSLSLREPPRDP